MNPINTWDLSRKKSNKTQIPWQRSWGLSWGRHEWFQREAWGISMDVHIYSTHVPLLCSSGGSCPTPCSSQRPGMLFPAGLVHTEPLLG